MVVGFALALLCGVLLACGIAASRTLERALISRRVDAVVGAYWTHESIMLEHQGHPVYIMRMEEWGVPDYYELVLVTNGGG